MELNARTRILFYTLQPFVGQGLASVLKSRQDFDLVGCDDDFATTVAHLLSDPPDIVLIYISPGISLARLRELRSANRHTTIVLWGTALSSEFVFQAMQAGIRGWLPDDTSTAALLAALCRIAKGELSFEPAVLEAALSQKRVVLSKRESQLVALVAQGLKNKEIAYSSGLTPGTVKCYLNRIFKKLNVDDRLDLALYGLKNMFGGQIGSGPSRERLAERDLVCPRALPLRSRESLAVRLLN